MRKENKNMSRGYTLAEMLGYIFVFCLISILVINALLILTKAFVSMKTSRAVGMGAVVSLDQIVKEVRNADSVSVSSILNTSPGKLVLTMPAGSPTTTVEFSLGNLNSLHKFENGIDQGVLTATGTDISRLVFIVATTTKTTAVSVEMTIRDSTGRTATTENFYSTATLRTY
jgi:hypothetical protein